MSKAKKAMVEAIKAGNKRFERATAAQKRVIVAEDAIAQVRAGRFHPMTGVYFDPCTGKNRNKTSEEAFKSLYKVTLNPDKFEGEQCVGCALGGLFLAKTINKPEKNVATFMDEAYEVGSYDYDTPADPLSSIFSADQLDLIEGVFEGFGGIRDDDNREIVNAWRDGPYRDDTTRFVAIMRNIVKNKGVFKPNQIPPKVPYNLHKPAAKKSTPKKVINKKRKVTE